MAGIAASAKGKAKRDEALRAALEVFAEEGYQHTSLRTVAQRCGLSLAGLMHYFDSREAMLAEVLRARDADGRARFGRSGDGVAYLLATVRHNSSVPGLVSLYVSLSAAAADRTHPAHDFFVERTARIRREIRATALELGRMPPAPLGVESATDLLLAVVDGVQLQWLADPGTDMEARVADALEVLFPAPSPGAGSR